MLDTLTALDDRVMVALNSHFTEWTDAFMWYFSGKLTWVGFYLCLLWAIKLRYGWRRSLGILVVIALVITLCDQACGHWVRDAVARLRPSNPANPISPLIHTVNGYRAGAYGFPSCHAANSFGLAVFISLLFKYRPVTVLMFAWAVVTAYSRIVLGVHYPGDLMVGACAGSIIAAVVYFIAKKVYYHYREKCAPWASRGHDCSRAESLRWICGGLLLTVAGIVLMATVTVSMS